MSRYLFDFASAEAKLAFGILFILFWVSESWIYHRSQAGAGDRTADRGSLRILSIVFPLAWWIGIALLPIPHGSFGGARVFSAGLVLMAAGQLLRWWSVATLGRLFTVTVAIRTEHRLIESGPYRYIRHPSYTAILLVHLGAGLCFGKALTLAVLVIPVAAALLYRIYVEEDALAEGLGAVYHEYMARTRRLIPRIY